MSSNTRSPGKISRGVYWMSFLTVLIVVLAACGGSNSTTTHTRPAHPNSLTLLANEQDAYTQNYDPYSPGVISGTQGLIYETLLYVNRLDGSVKPWLASSYDLASDAQSITFHVRQGVTWSDGQPLTSDDVAFTLNLILKNPSIDLTGIGAAVKDVSAPDASTVKVTLYLYLTKAPFNDLQVRKAISFALNRETISKLGESGYEPPANPTGLVGEAIHSYIDPQFATLQVTQNTAQADQTLQSDGWTK